MIGDIEVRTSVRLIDSAAELRPWRITSVVTGSAFTEGEMLTLGGERMLIQDIAGNSLTVKRAQDGSVLDSSGVAITRFASNEVGAAAAPAPKGQWGVAYASGDIGSTSISFRTAAK